MTVPVIDLSGFSEGDESHRARIASDVNEACRSIGFFSVVGHGVDPEIVETAHRTALEFFALPLADRMDAVVPEPSYPYGYRPFTAEALNKSIGGAGRPDLKETFNMGPLSAAPDSYSPASDSAERGVWAPTPWPSVMPELRTALEAYYQVMADLSATLMNTFAYALNLGSGWFEPFIDNHPSAMRLAYYPALEQPPEAEDLRAGAHTDYGTLTILRLDAEPGLQVQGADGNWADVSAPAGALVVNLGDLTQRWSNDRWRSTMHRVVVPEGHHDRARMTMPFFHNANWDALVECIVAEGEEPKHEPVRAGAYLMDKFRSTVE